MVVRFLPIRDEDSVALPRDREDLAEVIELRSRLPRIADVREQIAEIEARSNDHEPSHSDPAVIEPEPVNDAMQDAVRLLARKARSSGELRRELVRLGHPESEVESVVLDCESSLYLDDLGLARLVCESMRERKRASRSQIRMKLRERLLPDGIIEEVLGELDEDEEQQLLRVAASDRARKLAGLDRQTAERRLLGFLARRGWSGEPASRIAREVLDNAAARGAVRFR